MALVLSDFIPMSAQGNSNAPRAFSYETTDAIATVEGANYFDDLAKTTGGYGLQTNDYVFCTMSDGTKIYQVSVSGSGVVTLPLSVEFS